MSDYFISHERAENDLLDCSAFIAERIRSSDGHAEAMNTIIPRYLVKGDVDLAAELSNAIDDPFSRDKLLIIVAEKCALLDDEEYGLQLVDAIEDHGLQSQAFERVALVIANKGHAERAAEVADSMGHADFVYAGIAVNQAENGNEAGADATIEGIEFPTARVFALQHIAASQIAAENYEKAVNSLSRARESAGEIEHDEEKIRAFCEIGNAFIEANASDRAIETFDQARALAELLDNQHRDFFIVNCALGFLHAGNGELADQTLDLVTDKTQMASALLGFARDHWRREEKDDAVDTLEESYAILKSQRDIETRDSRSRNALLANIASQFAGFGKSDRGVEIALENQDASEQMAALSQIAQILTVQNEHELARETINLIGDDEGRMIALVTISDVHYKRGETETAITVLDEAATLAETVPQLSVRSSVLNEIADRYVGLGQPEKSRAISLENLAVIAEIRDESSKAVSLANLSAIYDQAGFDLNEAELTAVSSMVRQASN